MLCSSRHQKYDSKQRRNPQATVIVAESQDIGHETVQNSKEKSNRYVLHSSILITRNPL